MDKLTLRSRLQIAAYVHAEEKNQSRKHERTTPDRAMFSARRVVYVAMMSTPPRKDEHRAAGFALTILMSLSALAPQ